MVRVSKCVVKLKRHEFCLRSDQKPRIMTNVQYLTDNQGERTSVVIPISEWLRLSKYLEELNSLDQIASSIEAGLKEAKTMEASHTQSTQSVNDFLDGL